MSNEPERVYIEEKDKDIYDKLLEKGSPLARDKGFGNKGVFLLAMCIGFDEGNRVELNKRRGYFWSKDLTREDKAIMYSIAAEEGGLEALIDKKKVYAIAEQYAAGGIHILYDGVFGGEFGSFAKHFENLLLKKFRDIHRS